MTRKMQLNNLDPVKDKEKLQQLLAKSQHKQAAAYQPLMADLLFLQQLRSLGSLTKLQWLGKLGPNTFRRILVSGILVQDGELYRVNDDLR